MGSTNLWEENVGSPTAQSKTFSVLLISTAPSVIAGMLFLAVRVCCVLRPFPAADSAIRQLQWEGSPAASASQVSVLSLASALIFRDAFMFLP